jgi:tRNA (guanine6-N2)-methyltransferase
MGKRRRTAELVPPCYALLFAGLEGVAQDEIERDLRGEVRKTSPGLLVFRTPVLDSSILLLRTVEDVFLFGWGTDELTHRARDLKSIESWTANQVDWAHLLRLHHAIHPKPKGKPSYRLVTQMIGEHGYRRTDARAALARGLAGVFPPSWRPADENASVEVWLTIREATAICGVRLSDRSMRHRSYKEAHQKASLRPTMAAAMARLADLRPGSVVVDPMCGAGTVLAEALERARVAQIRGILFLGGDVDLTAVRSTAFNTRSLGRVHLHRWDARHLPLPNAAVDRVISNPPFGKQLETAETVGPLYREMVAEYDRVLKPKGKAVLLVSEQRLLQAAASAVNWKLLEKTKVRVLGQGAFMTVWQKPGVGGVR